METDQMTAYRERVRSLKEVSNYLVAAVNQIDYADDAHIEEGLSDVLSEVEDQITYLMSEITGGVNA